MGKVCLSLGLEQKDGCDINPWIFVKTSGYMNFCMAVIAATTLQSFVTLATPTKRWCDN